MVRDVVKHEYIWTVEDGTEFGFQASRKMLEIQGGGGDEAKQTECPTVWKRGTREKRGPPSEVEWTRGSAMKNLILIVYRRSTDYILRLFMDSRCQSTK